MFVEGHGPQAGAKRFLRVDGRDEPVPLSFDVAPDWRSGTELTLHGEYQGDVFHVTDYQASAEDNGALRQALIGQPLVRSRTVGFVMADLGDGINITKATAESFMYGLTNPGPKAGIRAGEKSVAQFYEETSYGMMKYSGAVEGPLSFTGDACSNYGSALTSALSSQIPKYDHRIWYYGSEQAGCGYGWGSEGTWSSPRGDVWFNGDVFGGAIQHELGHNLGLLHASSMKCGSVPLADDPMTCTTVEYGDPVDIMGNLGAGHMMGAEKWYAGWFGGCNGVRVKSSGTFNLFPIETACNGIQTLQIPMPKTTRTFTTEQSDKPTPARFYYLEFRQSIGLDTGITPQVMVRISDDIKPQNTYCARSAALDMVPSSNAHNGMTAGQTFTDPAGGVTFKVDSLDTTKAVVTVTLANGSGASTCIDNTPLQGNGPTSCTDGAGGSGSGGASSGGAAAGGASSGGAGGTAAGGTAAGGTSNSGGNTNRGGGTAAGGSSNSGGSSGTSGGAAGAGGSFASGGVAVAGAAGAGGSSAGATGAQGGAPSGTAGAAGLAGSAGSVASGGALAAAGAGGTGAGAPPVAGAAPIAGASPVGGAASFGGSAAAGAATIPPAESGCSCSTRPSSRGPGLLGVVALGLVGLRRRRSRRQ